MCSAPSAHHQSFIFSNYFTFNLSLTTTEISPAICIILPYPAAQPDPTDPHFIHLYGDGDKMEEQVAAF